FLVTLSLMGIATTLTGFLPGYAQVGILAPALLVLLRLLQGLALGGEYGGAATYIAEHAPDSRRGYYTSYIQTTAPVGFFVALLGATAGQAVVWYTGQFYALFFLQTIVKVPTVAATIVVAIALLIGTPFFLVFGALSDRIGRKPIIMAGCLIAAITYIPIYKAM